MIIGPMRFRNLILGATGAVLKFILRTTVLYATDVDVFLTSVQKIHVI